MCSIVFDYTDESNRTKTQKIDFSLSDTRSQERLDFKVIIIRETIKWLFVF